MKIFVLSLILSVGLISGPASAFSTGTDLVVPNANAATEGQNTFAGVLTGNSLTLQMLIHEDQLSSVVGQNLNAVQWRTPPTPSGFFREFPSTDLQFNNFDIRLSQGVVPSDISFRYSDNIVGQQTLVRSGPLTIAAGSYTSGLVPNEFGTSIPFSNYLYTGGHLLFELRHDGLVGGLQRLDAVGSFGATQFSSIFDGSYTGTTGLPASFLITQFSTSPIPEPSSSILLAIISVACGLCRKRTLNLP